MPFGDAIVGTIESAQLNANTTYRTTIDTTHTRPHCSALKQTEHNTVFTTVRITYL